MARSRGRGRTTTRRRQPRADWVYRSNARADDAVGSDADVIGTYEMNIPPHAGGPGNAQGHILYDSVNYLAQFGAGGNIVGGVQRMIGRAARAEGRKPCILAVEGIIYWEPSIWALGNLMAIGTRFGVFEQDPGTGQVLLDPAYSMWMNEVGGSQSKPAQWANGTRGNAMERRTHVGYSDTRPFHVERWRFRTRRFLAANECFAVYTELENTSVDTRTQWWLRTLVADEG